MNANREACGSQRPCLSPSYLFPASSRHAMYIMHHVCVSSPVQDTSKSDCLFIRFIGGNLRLFKAWPCDFKSFVQSAMQSALQRGKFPFSFKNNRDQKTLLCTMGHSLFFLVY